MSRSIWLGLASTGICMALASVGVTAPPSGNATNTKASTVPAVAQAEREVKAYHERQAALVREKGLLAAQETLLAPDYTLQMPGQPDVTREQVLSAIRRNKVIQRAAVQPGQEEADADGTTIGLTPRQERWKPSRFEIKGDTIIETRYTQSKRRQKMPIGPDGFLNVKNPTPDQMLEVEVKHLQAIRSTYVRTPDGLRLRRTETPFYKMYVNGQEIALKKLLAEGAASNQFQEPDKQTPPETSSVEQPQ